MFSKMKSQRKRPPDRFESDRFICRPFGGLILSASDNKQPIVNDKSADMVGNISVVAATPMRLELKLLPIAVQQNLQFATPFSRRTQKKKPMRENAKDVHTNAIHAEVARPKRKRFRAFHTGEETF